VEGATRTGSGGSHTMHIERIGSNGSNILVPVLDVGGAFDGADPEIRMGLLGQMDSPMMK